MSKKNPFEIPENGGQGRDAFAEIDDLHQIINSQRQEIEALIAATDAKISKPGIRGGFNVDDILSYGTIQQAVNAIASTQNKTLFLTNAQPITANLTIPSNISIVALKGGSFTISAGKTLTINGSFESQGNNLSDLFAGAGAYAFGKAVLLFGAGSPETVVTAPMGSLFLRNNGAASTTLYIKQTGTGNTGWTVFGGLTGSGAANQVALWTAAAVLAGSANLTFDGAILALSGHLNVLGAVDTANYSVNVLTGSIALAGGYAFEAFGVGAPGVTNYERVYLTHTGASGVNLVVDKGGTGTNRDLNLLVGGSVALALQATTQRAFCYGDVIITTLGKGLYIKQGTNGTSGVGQLVGGVLLINNTKVTANTGVAVLDQGGGVLANAGALYEDSAVRVPGTSFTVKSLNPLDTSKFFWFFVEPAP